MLRRTSQAIDAAVAEYAKANGIDIVLQLPSRLGAGSGVIYHDEKTDITAQIMDKLGIKEPEDDEKDDGDEADAEAKPAPAAEGAAEAAKE